MSAIVGLRVNTEKALDWVRGSLAQGSDLAGLVGAKLPAFGFAVLLVDPSRAPDLEPELDDKARGIPVSEADDIARRVLAGAARAGKVTLIIEDDLARRGDPRVEGAAFVGDRVLRWAEVVDEARDAATLLRKGSSGYPMNGYICLGGAAELRLTPQADLGPAEQEQIVESVVGVIVSVWDAEAFVAVLSPVLSG